MIALTASRRLHPNATGLAAAETDFGAPKWKLRGSIKAVLGEPSMTARSAPAMCRTWRRVLARAGLRALEGDEHLVVLGPRADLDGEGDFAHH